jgi:hypothetical protein
VLLWVFFVTVPAFFLLTLFNFLIGILSDAFIDEKLKVEKDDIVSKTQGLLQLCGCLDSGQRRALESVLRQLEQRCYERAGDGLHGSLNSGELVTPSSSARNAAEAAKESAEDELMRVEIAACLTNPAVMDKLPVHLRSLPQPELELLIVKRLQKA